jgi:uncharacterized protein
MLLFLLGGQWLSDIDFSNLPFLGVGLSYHADIREGIFEHREKLDFIEVVHERIQHSIKDDILDQLKDHMPILCHGVNLSLGAAQPLDINHLKTIQHSLTTLNSPWFSEHISFSNVGGVDVGHLVPLRFAPDIISTFVEKVKELKRHIDRPLLLENITYYFAIPDAEMSELDFLNDLIEQSQCGLLLDVNNLFINSQNHGYDPYEFLDALPFESIVEVHLAGGEQREGLFIDTHGSSIVDEVWSLYDYICARAPIKAVVIERDNNIPPIEELLYEVEKARSILLSHCAATSVVVD